MSCPVSGHLPSANAAAFDPFTGDYQVDPAEALRWSREQEPVFFSPKLGYWVVTRYQDVKAVFRDHAHFSPAIALEKITPTVEAADEVLRGYDYGMNRTLVNEDEPDHMRRRRALMEPFTAEALAPHEEMVRRLAREAVDSFVDAGSADLVAEMLYFVPLTVAMHFMGIPEEDMGPLKEFSVAHTVNTWGRPAPEEQVAVAHQVGRFWQYAGGVLERMRANPDRPGWMPYSIRVQRDERAQGCPVGQETVHDSYLHSMMMAGIVAAHETTAHAGANAVRLLLEEPERWQQLCADPSLIPNAVEECLRLRGSVAAWRRIALADTEVGGVPIPRGSKLLIVQASANHDADRFENADDFDVYRTEASDHLTFGYGAHQCLGKNLARMELQVFLEELTTRLPHLRLAEQEFTFVPNTSFRGPERLLVEWDPEQNPERTAPEILQQRQLLRIGEPSRHTLGRTLRVVEMIPETAEVTRVVLADPSGKPLPAWNPGAHLDVECGTDANGKQRSRQYSLCGRPGPHWEVAVLREDDGRGGSRWLHEHTRVGADWRVRGPSNHFRLDRGEVAPQTPVLLIAGGIGITPIAAMAHALRAAGRAYTLHYSGRSRQTMALLERLQADHGEALVVHAADEGHRADYAAILAAAGNAEVYACGPQRLLAALAELVPAERLHVEHFTSTLGELDPSTEHAFELRLADSGQTLVVPPDRTVLDTLRAANLDVPSDCEEGLCGTCEVPVLAGEVDHRDLVLDAGERAANRSMMSCCSRARGDSLTLGL
ncbi:cytochrome [Enemella evansiae]|uniref:cytochrome P450/oxidoreductase n=1 Tax=Enemella evansiae TaxID=2016499 RepID=UPI000B95F9C9|nr:cytochrome P450/oxidoreductase [Enemella evansiae]OYO14148.1 cytochrome [Enemella evansiae]